MWTIYIIYVLPTGEFTIDTKLAGIGTLLVRVHGIRDSFKIEAHPVSADKPRLLSASYHPTLSGEYTIFVRWSGVHVPGSPFTILIREGMYHFRNTIAAALYKAKGCNSKELVLSSNTFFKVFFA